MPISIALTGFHFLLLYKDRVVGVSNLNDKVVYEEVLPLVSRSRYAYAVADDVSTQGQNEIVLGLTADPVRKTYWIYTDQSLFELVVGNEDRDVWNLYLERGNHEVALRYAKVGRLFISFNLITLYRPQANVIGF